MSTTRVHNNRVIGAVRQGEIWRFNARVKNDGDTWPLTGKIIKCALVDRRGAVVLALTEQTGEMIVDRDEGLIFIELDANQTVALDPTTYGFHLDIGDDPDHPLAFLNGELSVQRGVKL